MRGRAFYAILGWLSVLTALGWLSVLTAVVIRLVNPEVPHWAVALVVVVLNTVAICGHEEDKEDAKKDGTP